MHGKNYTVQALPSLINLRLYGSSGPTAKDKVTAWLPLGCKINILQFRSRLMNIKSVAQLFFTQGTSRDYVIEIESQAICLVHGGIIFTMAM